MKTSYYIFRYCTPDIESQFQEIAQWLHTWIETCTEFTVLRLITCMKTGYGRVRKEKQSLKTVRVHKITINYSYIKYKFIMFVKIYFHLILTTILIQILHGAPPCKDSSYKLRFNSLKYQLYGIIKIRVSFGLNNIMICQRENVMGTSVGRYLQ